MSIYNQLNNREKGKTVFIIGSGPQLNLLSEQQIKLLEGKPTIGVNRVQYKIKTRYFISAYPSEILLASKRIPDSSILIHIRPIMECLFFKPNILTIKREVFDTNVGLNRFLDEINPVIFTKMNVALAATHLAFILGAARIVYIGVEQRNKVHYYDENDRIKSEIKEDLIKLEKHAPIFNIDHSDSTYNNLLDILDQNIEYLKSSNFYSLDHRKTFKEYFKILREEGLEIYTTKKDSVVFDAGAAYQPIEYFLMDSTSSISKIELAQSNLARSKLWLEQVKLNLEAYKSNQPFLD